MWVGLLMSLLGYTPPILLVYIWGGEIYKTGNKIGCVPLLPSPIFFLPVPIPSPSLLRNAPCPVLFSTCPYKFASWRWWMHHFFQHLLAFASRSDWAINLCVPFLEIALSYFFKVKTIAQSSRKVTNLEGEESTTLCIIEKNAFVLLAFFCYLEEKNNPEAKQTGFTWQCSLLPISQGNWIKEMGADRETEESWEEGSLCWREKRYVPQTLPKS